MLVVELCDDVAVALFLQGGSQSATVAFQKLQTIFLLVSFYNLHILHANGKQEVGACFLARVLDPLHCALFLSSQFLRKHIRGCGTARYSQWSNISGRYTFKR
jgi:hypothetical protein